MAVKSSEVLASPTIRTLNMCRLSKLSVWFSSVCEVECEHGLVHSLRNELIRGLKDPVMKALFG